MLRSRLCDEKIITLYKQNKCHFQIGVAGHEAIQVAAVHAMHPGKDWFYPYYRGMAIAAALGMSNEDMMLMALNKEDDPTSHGRQMPMHYSSPDLHIVSQSSPTGTQFLQAVGTALAIRKSGDDAVVLVSAGEGTCSQGDFHEALNWSSREKLPIIFLIENNGYAISVPISEQIAGESLYKLTAGYPDLARFEVDGSNYIESFEATHAAATYARSGKGPALIEAHVARLQSHSISDNQLKYRTAEAVEADKKKCPIAALEKQIKKSKAAKQSELDEIGQRIKNEINIAAEWAEAQPDPDPADALKNTIKHPNPGAGIEEKIADGPEVFIVDAINHALDEELAHDPKTYIYGQDVAHGKGGVFTITSGLTEKFGKERVFNGPLAESSLVGVGIGMAAYGLKPIVEIQFGDYIWTGMMQIRNELAMMHYRSGGEWNCPVVLRIPIGGYIHGACYHSQNIEATLAHFPGLQVILPSNATDAKGLLKAAIRSDNPVLFLEHKGLYRQVFAKGAEGGPEDLIPIGKAKKIREGDDLTIITYGALVQKSISAAEVLANEGYSVEIIDLRTIVPLDTTAIYESVRKTNRVLIAHEDVEFMGFGAEIGSLIAQNCFEDLDAPIKRVGMKYAAAVPHSPVLENVILPQNEDVLIAARNVLSY